MFSFFKTRQRRQWRQMPFPHEWQSLADHHVDHYRRVDSGQREQLHGLAQVLLHEKRWEGCDGLQITDAMRVTIAVQMAVMLLGVRDYYFDHVSTVLVYPSDIRRRDHSADADDEGLVTESVHVDGEAWHEGSVVLSWAAVDRQCRNPRARRNVVIHEMAHQIDRIDGEMGGSPPLANRKLQNKWQRVARREFQALTAAIDTGQWHFLDDYAATSPAEFFAVATEAFFRQPLALATHHAELFALLVALYQVDPRPWFSAAETK